MAIGGFSNPALKNWDWVYAGEESLPIYRFFKSIMGLKCRWGRVSYRNISEIRGKMPLLREVRVDLTVIFS